MEAELQDSLLVFLPGAQAEQHRASMRRLPIVEVRDMLDQKLPWPPRVHGLGLSSIP